MSVFISIDIVRGLYFMIDIEMISPTPRVIFCLDTSAFLADFRLLTGVILHTSYSVLISSVRSGPSVKDAGLILSGDPRAPTSGVGGYGSDGGDTS